jgi:hypothetical protein
VKFFHSRDLDVPPQEREVVYVPRQLDALLLGAVGFHRTERIVGPVLSVVIDVGEVLQIGEMLS